MELPRADMQVVENAAPSGVQFEPFAEILPFSTRSWRHSIRIAPPPSPPLPPMFTPPPLPGSTGAFELPYVAPPGTP